jgi:tetrahydromethanopterin S-methyltransferase subunit G
MPLPDNLVENIVTAVISGGGTALSAIVAFFRDVKKRLDDVEKRVGSIEGRSGIVYSVHQLEEATKKLQGTLDGWAANPPEWMMRLIASGDRRRHPSLVNLEEFGDLDSKLRDLNRRLKDVEETLERVEKRVYQSVLEEDFDAADRQRAEDIAQLRTTLAEVSGLLKGLQSALGLIKHR